MPTLKSAAKWTNDNSPKRQVYGFVTIACLTVAPWLVLPRLRQDLFRTNFLPHMYCYLQNPRLVWANAAADSLIGFAYLSISATIAYLVFKSRRNIPLHWLFLAFGLFIGMCGGTHILEAVTIWVPIYVLSAVLKTWTAIVSLVAAILLPLQVSYILTSVEKARQAESVTARLRASEERKDILLQEVHHRVKNNLALMSSLFYLQSTHTRDPKMTQIFRDMENRVHAMALVHESLYSSESLKAINFADFVRKLAEEIVASYESPDSAVRLIVDLEPMVMSVDTALPCGLILNELMSNAFKHGLPSGAGEITLTLRNGAKGKCTFAVENTGTSTISSNVVADKGKSFGLRLVRLLSRQIGATFELTSANAGNRALLQFTVTNNGSQS